MYCIYNLYYTFTYFDTNLIEKKSICFSHGPHLSFYLQLISDERTLHFLKYFGKLQKNEMIIHLGININTYLFLVHADKIPFQSKFFILHFWEKKFSKRRLTNYFKEKDS